MKHNKKRNIAFIYETLSREVTKAVLEKNDSRKKTIVSLLREHFKEGGILLEELRLYRALLETQNIKKEVAERLLQETKYAYSKIDSTELFDAQSKLISAINKDVGQEVWANFVPNFKSLASISAIFNTRTPVKKKVLFEQAVVDQMSTVPEQLKEENLKSVDAIVYNSFIKKFNNKYSDLLTEQKELLNHYITSFADDGFQLKIYLNEELSRLKSSLDSVDNDQLLIAQKLEGVANYLESFRRREFDETDLHKVLKTQELAQELHINDNN